MKEKMKLSGIPETMLQTLYARSKETRFPTKHYESSEDIRNK